MQKKNNRLYTLFEPDNKSAKSGFTERMDQLYKHQIETWLLLQDGVQNLSSTKSKVFLESRHKLILQYNPQRIKSTNANIASEIIKNRPCFLCSSNLPAEQRALPLNKDFLLLCNPFPIFKKHFTLIFNRHITQNITSYFSKFLEAAKIVSPGYNIFYNGPECGASAPDHLHFQLCPRFSTPLENEHNLLLENSKKLSKKQNIQILSSSLNERKFFTITSPSDKLITECFVKIINLLKNIYKSENEPKLNLFCWYDSGEWVLHLFPRERHRPEQFYLENENKIIISPAAVDFCGVLITPSKENFENLKIQDLKNIFRQTTISNEYFEFLQVKVERLLK